MSSSEHIRATPGAWLAVFLIIIAFILGTLALILHSTPLWIATGVVALCGITSAVRSKILEQAY